MPTMKHVMIVALIASATLAAPAVHADPDPHKPDLGRNYCPGGATPSPEVSCDGVPYDDGSYWHATQHATASNYNFVVVQCVVPPPAVGPFSGVVPQPAGPLPAAPDGCGRSAQ